MVHQDPLPFHRYLQLVIDTGEELLELPEVLPLTGVRVMITSDKHYLTMQQAFEILYGGKAATFIAEVAKVEHDGIFRHCIVPVID